MNEGIMTEIEKKLCDALQEIAERSIYSHTLTSLEVAQMRLRDCWNISHRALDPVGSRTSTNDLPRDEIAATSRVASEAGNQTLPPKLVPRHLFKGEESDDGRTADAGQPNQPTVVKVPGRDMGDGRTQIDSLYLPDWFVVGKFHYTIVATRPTSRTGEWANKVCTLKIDR